MRDGKNNLPLPNLSRWKMRLLDAPESTALRDTRDAHLSFVLMRPDEIDKRLLPGIKAIKWDAHGKTDADSNICPVWDIIRSSW